jgi:hypothetical protein
MKVRFYVLEYDNPVQDYELPAVPRHGEQVELTLADGSPVTFVVAQVTWTPHDVIPADVVVMLENVP